MMKRVCFSIWGCGREVHGEQCSFCLGVTREFNSSEEFMRKCGKLPTIETFRRAYNVITGIPADIMAEEHYRRKHQQLSLVDEDEKERAKDPYLNKFSLIEQERPQIVKQPPPVE